MSKARVEGHLSQNPCISTFLVIQKLSRAFHPSRFTSILKTFAAQAADSLYFEALRAISAAQEQASLNDGLEHLCVSVAQKL